MLTAGLAIAAGSAVACNPDAPVHPVLQEQPYDSIARKVLTLQAETIVIARLLTQVDLTFESADAGDRSSLPTYQFDVREGWKKIRSRRLTVDGYWVPCELALKPGGWFLIFLDGDRPLYLRSADNTQAGLDALGDIEWFYTHGGELVRPELVDDVPQSRQGPDGGGE